MENLAKALVAFQKELPKIGKDKTVSVRTQGGGNYSYSYADLASLTHTVLPLLVKHGLAFTTAGNATEAGYELRAMLLHESGEYITGSLPIYGRQPQEIGSAITYARRYLLGCMTGVVTEDDDDANAAVHAERTPAKDWDAVADTAESLTALEDLQELWRREDVGKAPKVIIDRIKAHGDMLEAERSGASND